MRQVVLVVDAEVDTSQQQVTSSPITERMVTALRQAIMSEPTGASTNPSGVDSSASFAVSTHKIQVISVRQLTQLEGSEQIVSSWAGQGQSSAPILVCPLTLNLPHTFAWPGQTIYQQCQDIDALRRRVEQQGTCSTEDGCYWLPIVLTAKGPLYGEVIGLVDNPVCEKPQNDPQFGYYQPLHLSDAWRQPLYELGFRLLRSLAAPPAAYLLQFGIQDQKICFDRL